MFEPNELKPGMLVFVGIECVITSYDKAKSTWVSTMDAIGFIVSNVTVEICDEYGYELANVLCMLSGYGLYYVPRSSIIRADRFKRLPNSHHHNQWDGKLVTASSPPE